MISDWIKQSINDRNVSNIKSMQFFEKWVSVLRTNYSVAVLGFKAATMQTQLAGIPNAIEMIGGKDGAANGTYWFTRGLREVMAHPIKMYRWVTAMSGEMKHRFENRDRDLRQKYLRLGDDWWGDLQKMGMDTIGFAEMMVSLPAWVGAYKKAIAGGMPERLAIQKANNAVNLSQGAAAAKDQAAFVAKNNQFAAAMTMFYTPFSAMYSRYRNMGHQVGGIRSLPLLAGRAVLLWGVMNAMAAMLGGDWPDEDDGDEKWRKWMIRNIAIGPAATVPMLRDIMNASLGGYKYRLTPLQDLPVTAVRLAKKSKKVLDGKAEVSELFPDFYRLTAYSVGLPGAAQAAISADYLYDLYTGEEEWPDSLPEFWKFLFLRRRFKK